MAQAYVEGNMCFFCENKNEKKRIGMYEYVFGNIFTVGQIGELLLSGRASRTITRHRTQSCTKGSFIYIVCIYVVARMLNIHDTHNPVDKRISDNNVCDTDTFYLLYMAWRCAIHIISRRDGFFSLIFLVWMSVRLR